MEQVRSTFSLQSLRHVIHKVDHRYTIASLSEVDFPGHLGWHAYYSFGKGSPRREYDLGHVRLPVQQYLLENIFPLSARHGIRDPAKLCLGQWDEFTLVCRVLMHLGSDYADLVH